ncbi:radical SAM family heme chaperone HemW [Kordiimonas marina]|uniref:radical SAM family heme chaperone HemW n=1 Tax=Kordiimonas marina TaxID=2872312 RepID=UPI001FF0ED2E|nr:radical SAM family heme chaperone HemW [Kordiimonas marina]MCJ9429882.1 radical SAM family heme chaperone HemW [Kordiimonas marina]
MPASNRPDVEAPALPASPHEGPAAIYVHWPFCLKKCPYCDFNSHVRDEISHADWRNALVTEIRHFTGLYPNLKASSIFFGGGTPSLMEPDTVAAVIDEVRSAWAPESEIEITLEANPSSVEAGRFRAYRQAGVNRLSIGIQSLRDDALQFLGRLHTVEEALKALEVARDNFGRASFDLIYARPGQSLTDWRQELSEALAFGMSHLSLYQLTIEEGTAFYHQFQRGKFTLPDEDEAAALYDLTLEMTDKAGLPAYEISNHARPGEESRHNLSYWQGDFYLGIGPGAHGRAPHPDFGAASATAQIKRPEDWLASVRAHGHGTQDIETVLAEDRMVEALMMGLRLMEGIDLKALENRFGVAAATVINAEMLQELTAGGYLQQSGSRLALTPKGRPLLNYLLGKLLA